MEILRLSLSALALFVLSLGVTGCRHPQQQAHDPLAVAVHTYQIDGLPVRTGDLICTNTTEGESLFQGFFYRLFGTVIPGPIDHVIVYVGPGGRCVEAGAKLRVITFDIAGNTWDASKMTKGRGPIYDMLYGIAYPLAGRSLSSGEENRIRRGVASYCLTQAEAGRPYNVAFLDSATDNAFYCSQLAYKAYLEQGIDLNTGQGLPDIPGMDSIVFPQEIWAGCEHVRAPRPSRGSAEPIP